jgi:ribosomal protein S18 acetylase RimI-like enzyme
VSPAEGEFRVEEAVVADPELHAAMVELLPQLSKSAPPMTAYALENIVDSPACTMLIVRDANGRIVGSLTLAMFQVPTGVRAWIEDVVVDGSVRGRGAGAALVEAALAHAKEAGARTVDLTSNPTRQEANRLYMRLGFERRETNVYRYALGG